MIASQILFFAPYSINKDYVWLQAHEFYKFNLMLITTLPNFHFVVFIVVVFCPISHSTHSLLGLYFHDSPSSFANPFKICLGA
jgi:fumarate reductase subunit C